MTQHTITTVDKALAAAILHNLRFVRGLDPHLSRDGARYVIRYDRPAG